MPTKNKQRGSNQANAQSRNVRYGAPSGPRQKRRESCDGREPLEYPGHEETAWFLALPKTLREFKSVAALARHFSITRKTIHCWMNDIDVLKRAEWLSEINKIAGKLVIRRASVVLAEKLVEMGMGGDITAIKVCMDFALREVKQTEKSGLTSASLDEVLARSHEQHIRNAEIMTPTWIKERDKRLAFAAQNGEPPSPGDVIDVAPTKAESEPQAAPEPDPANLCDACGKARCTHGRCPTCDICEVCK